MALIIQEARRNGGAGWRSYDAIFRQNAAANPDIDWSQLDSALYSSTVLAHRSQLGHFCHLCFSSDHTSRDCALQSYHSEECHGKSPARSGGATADRSGGSGIPVCISWNKD